MKITALAEKETVLKAGKAVRPDLTWVAAQGHLIETIMPAKGDPNYFVLDALPHAPKQLPTREIRATAHKLTAAIRAIAGADRVIIACDWDREGTLIAAEILERAGWRKPVEYINSSDPTAKAMTREIEKAVRGESHRDRFVRWSLEAGCRQYEDYLVGLNATQLASLVLRPPGESGVWGSGPVQTAIVGLVRRRELEIENFKPTDYFEIEATVSTASKATVVLTHAPADAQRIGDRRLADEIAAAVRRFEGPLAVVTKSVEVAPPRLFDLPSLQSTAAKRWGWSPSKTLDVAQSLYEPGGPELLTYPRAEGRFLPEDHIQFIGPKLAAIATLPALKDKLDQVVARRAWIVRKGERYNTKKVLGHHAIVPTEEKPAEKQLSADQRLLYEMIALNFAANHLPDAVDDRTEISIAMLVAGANRVFKATGSVERSPGWRSVIDFGDEDEDGRATRLPKIADGERGKVVDSKRNDCRTRPPKPFTLGSLITAMCRLIDMVEDPEVKDALRTSNPDLPMGLGTPATRDSHIAKVIGERGYLETLKGKAKDPAVRTTDLGRRYYEAWNQAWPELVDPVSRAKTEFRLRQVSDDEVPLAENHARAERYKEEVRRRVGAMVEAVKAKAPAIARVAGPRPPSEAMLKAAVARAAERNVVLPPEAARDGAACKAFLDAHPREEGAAVSRPPSEAQVGFARKIAGEKRIELPDGLDSKSLSAWIDKHISRGSGKGSGGFKGGKGRRPAPRQGRRRA